MAMLGMGKAAFAAGLAAAVSASVAEAADLGAPVPAIERAPYSWTGFYVGGNVGGNITSNWNADTQAGSTFTFHDDNSGQIAPTLDTGTGRAIGGVQAGYNWQNGWLVAGGEWDISAIEAGGGSSAPMFVPVQGYLLDTSASEWLRCLSTVRGRVGYVLFDRWMIFATAGLAFGEVQGHGEVSMIGNPNYVWSKSTNDLKAGYAIGGGVEWAITDRWTLRLEGYYYNIGSTQSAATGNAAVMADPALSNYRYVYKITTAGDVLRVGADYKF
jgi:outer membrane immunogenic protein